MQCYRYLTIRYYARSRLGEWTEHFDELELAGMLDEEDVADFADVKRIN